MRVKFSRFPNIRTTQAKGEEMTWEALVTQLFSQHRVGESKDGPLFSPAIYPLGGKRSNSEVTALSLLVLDVDNKPQSKGELSLSIPPLLPTQVEQALEGVAWAYYSTHSSTNDSPRWRLVVLPDREIVPEEYATIHQGLVRLLGNHPHIDGSCKDLSRAYWLPSAPPDLYPFRFSGEHKGEPFPIDSLLNFNGPAVSAKQVVHFGHLPKLPTKRGRNNALKAKVATLLATTESLERIIQQVHDFDQNSHHPPLFGDHSEGYKGGTLAGAMRFVANIIFSINQERVSRGEPEQLPKLRPQSQPVESLVSGSEEGKQMTPQFPPELLQVEGVLGEMTHYMDATSVKPQPVFSLAASLTALGTLLERRFATSTGLRTNEYIIAVGPTGCGKNHARLAINRIFQELHRWHLLGGEELASGQGLLARVWESPNVLFMLDEFGQLLQSATAASDSHKGQIITNLTKLFSSAASPAFRGTEYADQKSRRRVDVGYPHVSLYATTTGEELWKAFRSNSVVNGSLNRFQVVETADPFPRRQRVATLGIPTGMRHWLEILKERVRREQVGLLVPPEHPLIVPHHPHAEERLDAFEQEVSDEILQNQGSGVEALWVRAWEHVSKKSLLHALGSDPGCSSIPLSSVEWAIGFVSYSINRLSLAVKDHVADTQHEADLKACTLAFKKAGAKGLTEREINRHPSFTRLKKCDRDGIFSTLQLGDRIRQQRIGTRGRPRQAWVWVG